MRKRRRRYATVLIERVGWREASYAWEFVMLWTVFRMDNGRPPRDVEELAGWWEPGYVRMTVFRRWQSFRGAFEPEGWRTPEEMWDALGMRPSEGTKVAMLAVPG